MEPRQEGMLKQELDQTPKLIGRSPEAKRIQDFAEKAAPSEHTILLRGETGVGKDHLAEIIHFLGRREWPFVPVDCGALTASLSETELFGHTQGAFTDARVTKPGLVQVAERGTLFFNEVANMGEGLQVKFLRILEKRSYRPVGGTREMQVNTRIIAATNADLEKAVQQGNLRPDLYHRLNGITFTVPPLRERASDIPDLAEHFLREEGVTKRFSAEATAVLMGYDWPGNIRELKNAVLRALFLSPPGREIEVEHVHPYLVGVGDREMPTLLEVERAYFREVLKKCRGNISRAAAIAGIDRKVMHAKVKKLQLSGFVDSLRERDLN